MHSRNGKIYWLSLQLTFKNLRNTFLAKVWIDDLCLKLGTLTHIQLIICDSLINYIHLVPLCYRVKIHFGFACVYFTDKMLKIILPKKKECTYYVH